MRQVIERWLARSREAVDASALVVDARVSRDVDRWTLALVLSSASGESVDRLSAKDCDTLVQVVALKVALAAELTAALESLDTQVARESPARTALRVQGGVAIGRLPNLSATFGVTGALDLSLVRFELGVAYSPPKVHELLRVPGLDLVLGGEVRAALREVVGNHVMASTDAEELKQVFAFGIGPLKREDTGLITRQRRDRQIICSWPAFKYWSSFSRSTLSIAARLRAGVFRCPLSRAQDVV